MAINEAWAQITDKLKEKPVLLICNASANYSAQTSSSLLAKLAPEQCKIAGSSSCLGTMSNAGYHSQQGYGLGLIAFSEDEGDFGAALVKQSDNPEKAAVQAMQKAISNADRPGELPDLVWLNAAPGQEEAILQGITSVIGNNVPVMGGSSADNDISGRWWQFCSQHIETDGVLLIAMYPQCQVGLSFHSGYAPTTHSGTVTKAENRLIYSIDDQPAAQVYNEWTNGLVDAQLQGGNILQISTFRPLGREAGRIEDVPYYALLHPEQILDHGAIRLFSNIKTGERITLMSGSLSSLSSRAGSVASGILKRHEWDNQQLAGALVVYCAGCMLGIQEHMNEVVTGLNTTLGRTPFHGMFTFGEQGCFIDGINRHANLMISVVVFAKK
jgi:hypothetical protein